MSAKAHEGRDATASSYAREGLVWISGRIPSWEGWLDVGSGCPVKWGESPSLELVS